MLLGFACSVFPERADLPESPEGGSSGRNGSGGASGGAHVSGGTQASGRTSAGGAETGGASAGMNAGGSAGGDGGTAGSAGSAGAGGVEGGDGGRGEAGTAGGSPEAGAGGVGGIGDGTGTGGSNSLGEGGGSAGSSGSGGSGGATLTTGGQGGGGCSTPITVALPATADTYLYEAKNQQQRNFGSEARLLVSGEVEARARAIVDFDLSSLSDANSVESAQLHLVLAAPAAGQRSLQLYRVGRAWQEDKATWLRAATSPATPWTLPGGDTALVASASQLLTSAAAGAAITFDVTADVKALITSGQLGYGWLVDAASADPPLEVSSRESLFAEERPELVVQRCP